MNRNGFHAVALAVALVSVPAGAHAAVITFEEAVAPAAMNNSPGAAVPVGSRLTNQYLAQGVLFSSAAGYAAVVFHLTSPENATPSFPNVIGGTLADGTLSYGSAVTATFVQPGNAGVLATTNFVRVLGDRFPLGSGTVTMNAFGLNGALLGSTTASDVGGIGTGPVLELSLPGIHRVTFAGTSNTVAFDNFEFGALTIPSASVPAPATLGLLALGLAGVGAARRSRR
jgi:hypothetical protein